MSKSCQGLLQEYVKCVRESDCVKVEGRDVRACAREAAACAGLRHAYATCKRGQLDPRARIRGNKGY